MSKSAFTEIFRIAGNVNLGIKEISQNKSTKLKLSISLFNWFFFKNFYDKIQRLTIQYSLIRSPELGGEPSDNKTL